MKKVLNISKRIDIGSRFNNFSLRSNFEKYGWRAKFASWSIPKTKSEDIIAVETKFASFSNSVKSTLSKYTGNVDGYYNNSKYFTKLNVYKQADLIHMHIIHENYLSLSDWSKISLGKPVVWTWHDPYPMHGHCLYSLDCMRFTTGCKHCPHLDYHFEVFRDRSAINLRERIEVVEKINPLIIVASEWMFDRVKKSKYGSSLRVEILPFGVELPSEVPDSLKARRALGIPDKNIVVGFRGINSSYKGIDLIKFAIHRLSKEYPSIPLTIVIFEGKGFIDELVGKYQIIESGWVEGEDIHEYYPALDFFLMPSKAEAFGLMAVEAMMHGVHPVITEGTALESLMINKNEAIISPHDKEAYYNLLVMTILGYKKHLRKKEALKDWAREKYSKKNYLDALTSIYNKEYARFYNH